MTNADFELKQASEAILQRGKMALESLQFREEAARIHAARIDLQAALGDAESGNSDRLQHWLHQYHSLLDNSAGHLVQNSIASNSYDPATIQARVVSSLSFGSLTPQSTPAVEEVVSSPYDTLDNKSEKTSKDASLGTRKESVVIRSLDQAIATESKTLGGTIGSPVENGDSSTLDKIAPNASDPSADFPRVKKSPWDAMMEAAIAREQAAVATPFADKGTDTKTPLSQDVFTNNLSSDESSAVPILMDDEPIAIPESIQQTLFQKKEPESKLSKLVWLSPALIWSTGAHLVAIIGMSAYVITMSVRTEPMAIVASPVETETVSMETPAEMAPMDTPEVEPTTMSTPNLPMVATPLASVSTSSMALPTAVAGDAPGEMPSSLGSAVGDAIGSSMSAVPSTAGAQFFGVNATGNTFCYIVDRSGSMRGGAFESAKEEIVRSLSTMKPKQRFYIFFFGEDIEGMKLDGRTEEAYPVYATPENIQKTIVWMDRVKIQGGKHPQEVVDRAIQMDPDGIFLLFDGETSVDLAPRIRKANLVNDIIQGEQTRVPIHSVCFYTENPEAQKLMKTIAQQNLGTYRYIPKPPSAPVGKRRFP